jgi:long-chain acyl-CoA synthetase
MEEFMGAKNDDLLLEELRTSAWSISGDTLATIIYTSGTTGKPKGVMLSHTNLVSNFMEVTRILAENPMKNALSVLPLCHVYERILNYAYQKSGISVHYVPSLNLLKEGLKHARPEIFCAVPGYSRNHLPVFSSVEGISGAQEKSIFLGGGKGQHYEPSAASGLLYGLKLLLADVFVFNKLRKGFGGRLNTIVCGGASLNPKLPDCYGQRESR